LNTRFLFGPEKHRRRDELEKKNDGESYTPDGYNNIYMCGKNLTRPAPPTSV